MLDSKLSHLLIAGWGLLRLLRTTTANAAAENHERNQAEEDENGSEDPAANTVEERFFPAVLVAVLVCRAVTPGSTCDELVDGRFTSVEKLEC